MQARYLMLAATGGGLLLGSVLGMTTSTTMKPGPEPLWRQAAHDSTGSSYAPAEADQPDINSAWSAEDRTPTWKRHQPEYQTADYAIPTYLDYAPPIETEVPDRAPDAPAQRTDAADSGRPADDAAAPAVPQDTITAAPAVPAAPAQAGA